MVIQPASSVPFKLSANKSSYKSALIGKWDVDTRIMWSDCPFVKVGKTANSQLVFSDVNGRVVPHWKANQWKLVRNNAIEFDYDADTLVWERENKLYEHGKYWYVEAQDKFNFASDGSLAGYSLVKQYLDGKYVGSYIMKSILAKQPSTIASR